MSDGSQQEDNPRESDEATHISEKAEDIVDILSGQRLKHIRMILNRVEDKMGELFLLN
ncbi:MAG: hypothetical protein HY755_08945 [Nitrospirae bacterium]|nr:hypothetical protein [Nitrospirota bacterium]